MPWGMIAASVAPSLIGGLMGSNASNDASNAAIAGQQAATAEQQRQYDTTRADNMQYMQNGKTANSRLMDLMGLSGNTNAAGYGSLARNFSQSDLANDAVYNNGLQFGLDQGTGAINARAVQQGGYDSGATLKALTKYANDYGTTKAEGAYNRFNTDNTNQYNRLGGISGTGQTATNQVNTAGQNMANNISNNDINAGNARAAGIMGGNAAWGSALGSVGQGINNYQSYDRLKSLLGNQSGGSGYKASWDTY